ncbi:MAG: ABC transporter substrate-binding protein [Ferrovibrio sp.]|uniref:ABC transporter substrate-binding protein n=1 Tax=Ferrovibrio sp. TaxID=1917215 RepID=UPI00260BF6BA|nr:ABC transporter substrate-binding protein [Ferrovibrio sp.]MCW0233657.1 ABC transporter substrate-binding protein [Ferrovibrio sp.]
MSATRFHLTRRALLAGTGAAAAAAFVPKRVFAQSGKTSVKFSLNLPRNGTNSPFIYALEKGYFAAEGIEITAMDPASGADALQRAATNTYDVSFADLTSLAEFYATFPDSVPLAVFNIYKITPAAIVSWKANKIEKPADLIGKTVGGPLTDNAYKLFPVFFKANGLDPAAVKFNNVDLRLRESQLMRREVDAVTGFDSTVWINLKKLGVKREDVSIMLYAEHGLDFYSNSVVVSRKFLKDNEAAIPGLCRAVCKGWQDAMKNPKAVTDALVKADALVNPEIEQDRLQWVLDNQVKTTEGRAIGLGAVEPGRLQRTIATIAQAYSLPKVAPVEAIWSGKYLPPLELRKVA